MTQSRKNVHAGRPPRPREGDGTELIFGIHAAAAALRNPRREIRAVTATGNAVTRLADSLAARGTGVETVSAATLSARLGGETVHQGVLIEAAPLPEPVLEDVLALLSQAASPGPLIVLDRITDPHNVGAILRSAAAFGAAALVMTRRRSPPGDGALAKAASGAMEHVPVVRVPNLARALEAIGAAGIIRVGFDGEARARFEDAPLDAPLALVFGAEDKGMRRLTRENCDRLCRLATTGPIASLNVSNAAAIALYTCLMARGGAPA